MSPEPTPPAFPVSGLWEPADPAVPQRHGDQVPVDRSVAVPPPPRRTPAPASEAKRKRHERGAAPSPGPALPTRATDEPDAVGVDEPRRTTLYLPEQVAELLRAQAVEQTIDQVVMGAYFAHHQEVERVLVQEVQPPGGLPIRRRRRKTSERLVPVGVYLTDRERELLRAPADQAGISTSAYVTALLRAAPPT